jgi:hypothetical protein
MSGPPYEDDRTIDDPSILWRRIHPDYVIYDENLGRHRPTSQAFQNQRGTNTISVVLAEVVCRDNRGPESVLANHDGYSLAQLTAGLARSLAQGVARDPVPQEPAHAVVFGEKPKSVTSALAKRCDWGSPRQLTSARSNTIPGRAAKATPLGMTEKIASNAPQSAEGHQAHAHLRSQTRERRRRVPKRNRGDQQTAGSEAARCPHLVPFWTPPGVGCRSNRGCGSRVSWKVRDKSATVGCAQVRSDSGHSTSTEDFAI